MKHARIPLLFACLLLVPPLQAQTDSRDELDREIQPVLIDLAGRDALGTAGEPLSISQPARVRYELGAVVDARSADPLGLEVLAVTPGSAATRLGLEPGDRLVAVNGMRLAATGTPAARLEQALQESDGKVQVQVTRDGATRLASGRADVAAVPAYSLVIGADTEVEGCGFVTTVFGVPPNSKQVFDAEITRIDGRSTPLFNTPNRFRLESGRHVLTVNERIERSRLGMLEQRQIKAMRRHEREDAYKPLVIDVKPDTSYRIGARLLKDGLDRDGITANEYWEPVVYEERPASCG